MRTEVKFEYVTLFNRFHIVVYWVALPVLFTTFISADTSSLFVSFTPRPFWSAWQSIIICQAYSIINTVDAIGIKPQNTTLTLVMLVIYDWNHCSVHLAGEKENIHLTHSTYKFTMVSVSYLQYCPYTNL